MDKEQQKELVKLCNEHFFTHAHWESLLRLIDLYIEPLKDIQDLDTTNKDNDQIATELRARQLAYDRLRQFVDDTLMLRKQTEQGVQNSTHKHR